ncbi:DUF1853 family protein [Neisseriaceae bacterium TC5R-5]|nr:DUF1853 family protein [Neisseriaceae bacterium TC5R-5]
MSNKTGYSLPYRHTVVRDLAFLLCSPPCWHSGVDISSSLLLGEHGEARLQQWDEQAAPLQLWLAQQPARRLGQYAEQLLGFWFQQMPHIELVAQNLAVRDPQQRTIGEFDFLLRIDGQAYHLEVTSKFYLQLGHTADTLVGPSLRDAWVLKAHKLQQQLQLSRHPAAQTVLPNGFADCHIGSRQTGWLFQATANPVTAAPLATALTGSYWPVSPPWPTQQPGSRWAWLPKLRWLAPAHLPYQHTFSEAELRSQLAQADHPQLVVELQEQSDGYWQEISRSFALPAAWPKEAALLPLLQRIDSIV